MKKLINDNPSLFGVICGILFIAILYGFVGCTTTSNPQTGVTTKQVDKEAIAQAVDIAVTILHDPVVSNAVYNAVNKK